jgi:PKD repeat protein
VTLVFGANPGNATIKGAATVTAKAGLAEFLDVAVSLPGEGYTLRAEAAGLTGAETAPFNLYNTAPEILSGPLALPNPVNVNSPTMLSVTMFDVDGDELSYAWDFGDGTTGTEESPLKAYAQVGTYLVNVTVSDGKGGTASGLVSVEVLSETSPPVIGNTQFPNVIACIPYRHELSVAGGVAPFSLQLTSGALPPGLELDSKTGAVSGSTAVSGGIYQFTIKVTDAVGKSTDSDVLTLEVSGGLTDLQPENPDTGLLLEKGRVIQRLATEGAPLKFKQVRNKATARQMTVLPGVGDDDLDLRGRLTAGGLSFNYADYKGVPLTIMLGDLVLVLELDEYAGFSSAKDTSPYVRFAISPSTGNFRLLLRDADLDAVCASFAATEDGRAVVRMSISLSTAAGVSSGSVVALFEVKSRTAQTFYDFNFRSSDTASGVFALTRFRATESANAHAMRIEGAFNIGQTPMPKADGTVRLTVGYRIFDIPASAFVADETRGTLNLKSGAVPELKRVSFDAGTQRFLIETNALRAHTDAAGNDSEEDLAAGAITGMFLKDATYNGKPVLAYVLYFGVELPLADGTTLKARVPARISRRSATDTKWGF